MAGETTSIVIFGGTGDLAQRKLLPALFQLACKGRLPERIRIVGVARGEQTDDSFRRLMEQGVREFGDLAPRTGEWSDFAKNLFFVRGDIDEPELYPRLKQTVRKDRGYQRQPAILPLGCTPVLRHRRREPGRIGLGRGGRRLAQSGDRKTLWPGLGIRAGSQPYSPPGLRRAAGLPHRPLSGQRDGSEPTGVPFFQRDIRARLEPKLRRQRADHCGGDSTSGGPSRLLRPIRGAARYGCRTTCCSC